MLRLPWLPQPSISHLLKPAIFGGQINIKKICKLANKGFNEFPFEDRALAWLAMLHIYPLNPNSWDDKFYEIVDHYWGFVMENELNDWHRRSFPSPIPQSLLNIQDNTLMLSINTDVIRMNRHLKYYQVRQINGSNPDGLDPLYFHCMEHVRRIERVLYIFAKSFPDIGYIQGMNELIFVFYYVFHKSLSIMHDNINNAEAFTYQCLVSLFQETNIINLYKISSESQNIVNTLTPFSKLIEDLLPNVHSHFTEMNIQPILYAFRWFNLMFAQEHEMPDILPIWDTLLAHSHLFIEYEFFIGIAHLTVLEEQILKNNDYGEILLLLQTPTDCPGENIVETAREFWKKTHHLMSKLTFGLIVV